MNVAAARAELRALTTFRCRLFVGVMPKAVQRLWLDRVRELQRALRGQEEEAPSIEGASLAGRVARR